MSNQGLFCVDFQEMATATSNRPTFYWTGISGASLPGKLAVLVRGGGDFRSASWKTAQDSTYMSDAFGRNVGESSAVSSGPLNDTEESSSPRADSTAAVVSTPDVERHWGRSGSKRDTDKEENRCESFEILELSRGKESFSEREYIDRRCRGLAVLVEAKYAREGCGRLGLWPGYRCVFRAGMNEQEQKVKEIGVRKRERGRRAASVRDVGARSKVWQKSQMSLDLLVRQLPETSGIPKMGAPRVHQGCTF
ncbi:hypothetical protein ALC56_07638 [Trachymyrmex septentrionalis]|uniref:Uncharacterized protein n=1 Tax=Trachymyrmex septentrionalis TaxID=34720 RepID=A0A195FD97_9HYME|nr:hypothetical protein ALC56_07638 [Trachymyrmex septentrionalis]